MTNQQYAQLPLSAQLLKQVFHGILMVCAVFLAKDTLGVANRVADALLPSACLAAARDTTRDRASLTSFALQRVPLA
eukprot:1153641-Pelagomonas_calceolata.AAC.2